MSTTTRLTDLTSLRPDHNDASDERVMDLLHEHVPLALLCDLQEAGGPQSAEILAVEGSPTQAWWDQGPTA